MRYDAWKQKLNIAVGLAASIGFAFRLRGLILTTSFQTNPVSLKDLMRECHEGKLQLPDFQRGWVWDQDRIIDLLASISEGFTVGALIDRKSTRLNSSH